MASSTPTMASYANCRGSRELLTRGPQLLEKPVCQKSTWHVRSVPLACTQRVLGCNFLGTEVVQEVLHSWGTLLNLNERLKRHWCISTSCPAQKQAAWGWCYPDPLFYWLGAVQLPSQMARCDGSLGGYHQDFLMCGVSGEVVSVGSVGGLRGSCTASCTVFCCVEVGQQLVGWGQRGCGLSKLLK